MELCNIGYPPGTHCNPNPIVAEKSLDSDLLPDCPIVLRFSTKHDSEIAVLCTKNKLKRPHKHKHGQGNIQMQLIWEFWNFVTHQFYTGDFHVIYTNVCFIKHDRWMLNADSWLAWLLLA